MAGLREDGSGRYQRAELRSPVLSLKRKSPLPASLKKKDRLWNRGSAEVVHMLAPQ